ncbi:hypothetical protein SAY87_029280 [Trapa incisa]|uniref:Cytochrome b5 heme-binding domain-containing protein n=1 Tax=Trapa incisa TaxID=236973 RepID=A0AAN7K7A0_9MYRT|nr:hypothetical protein SAY87_029280 [Trapa incisa]
MLRLPIHSFFILQVAAPDSDNEKKLSGGFDTNINDESIIDSGCQQNGSLPGDKSQNSLTPSRQEIVGSLSFKVTDRSTLKNERNAAPADANSSIKKPQELHAGGKKPAARAKVPFEKGYSQMDWLKLTRTHPDLAGLKGQSNRRLISINEVKQHQMEGSMWTVLKGRVYNLSPYMKFHPGGVDMLMKAVGKDCTSLFSILSKFFFMLSLLVIFLSHLSVNSWPLPRKKDKFLHILNRCRFHIVHFPFSRYVMHVISQWLLFPNLH